MRVAIATDDAFPSEQARLIMMWALAEKQGLLNEQAMDKVEQTRDDSDRKDKLIDYVSVLRH